MRTYFPGLNGLRFVAAALVLLSHADKVLPHPHSHDGTPWAHLLINNGGSAVTFFFVLSGFLITHLLLEERQQTGDVSVKGFYIKRLVRIWPLYYAVMLITLVALPFVFQNVLGISFKTLGWQQSALCAAMLPNVAFVLGDMGKLFHLWSIGVEEQFYLIWPWVLKRIQRLFVSLSLGFIIFKMLFFGFTEGYVSDFWYEFVNRLGFEKMAVGAVGAWFWYYEKEKIKALPLWSTSAQLALLCALLVGLSFSSEVLSDFPILARAHQFLFGGMLGLYIVQPLLFLYLILNTSTNPNSLLKADKPLLRYLGDISYGLYMYHMLAVYLSITLVKNLPSGWLQETLFYLIAFSADIALAAFSYKYFELWFLRFRPKKGF